ncbi:MAG: purine-nucleoside phosphorylase [bacterium]
MKKAIILGSGLDILSGESPIESIPYTEIPGWPLGKVKGHKGVLDKYKNIWVLRGRAHLYEGFTWEQACFPTQYLIDQGIEELILTNAAGGIDPNYEIGDLMQITGYLNFMKPDKSRKLSRILQKPTIFNTELINNPQNENAALGVPEQNLNIRLHQGRVAKRTSSRLRRTHDRSAISSDAEDATPVSYASKRKYKLRLLGVHEDHEAGENAEIGVSLHAHQGIYVGVHGPNYETHSEIALFKSMGASAVGMSTIPEIETAVKNNVKVTAISIITNVYGKTVDLGHEGVVQAAKNASEKLARLLCLS